jgi:hypothetical protein
MRIEVPPIGSAATHRAFSVITQHGLCSDICPVATPMSNGALHMPARYAGRSSRYLAQVVREDIVDC